MAVLDTDYNSTYAITDVINNAPTDGVNDAGVFQGSLYSVMNDLVTNFNLTLTKLDADGGVNDTNYNSTYAATALASVGNGISATGIHQGDIVTSLQELETNFNGTLTKLDSDSGTTDSDYNSTLAVDLNNSVSGTGVSQDDIVSFLDSLLANFNSLLTKLDAD